MTVDFSKVAKEYHRLGLNQQSAGAKLIEQINWQGYESVIDLGCGDGRLASVIAGLTSGEITGVDISPGMINTALKQLPKGHFIEGDIETLNFEQLGTFDVVFINSVIHWFSQPAETLKNIQQLMSKNGCLAIQTPLKTWCVQLQNIIKEVISSESLKKIYSNYQSPWFHLTTLDEYTQFFNGLGYKVQYAEEDKVLTNLVSPLKLWDLFLSGPAQAYFNQENFSRSIPTNLEIIFKDAFCSIAENMAISHVEYRRAFFRISKH